MREWVTTYFSYQLGTYTAAEKIRGVIFFKDGIKSSEKKAKAPALAEGAGARRRPNDGPLLHWTCTCTTIAHWYTIKFYSYYYYTTNCFSFTIYCCEGKNLVLDEMWNVGTWKTHTHSNSRLISWLKIRAEGFLLLFVVCKDEQIG